MASYQWIKLYDEILEDPKMGRLSDGAYRFCINLFLLASRQEARDGSLPELTDVAWALRLSEEVARSHVAELVKYGIVKQSGDTFAVINFQKRQGPSDSTERSRQSRDRNRGESKTSNESLQPSQRSRDTWATKLWKPIPATPGIYKITCSGSGLVYIGASVNMQSRVRAHLSEMSSTSHHVMSADFSEYGSDSITIAVLEECPEEKLREKERHHIDQYPQDGTYNRETLGKKHHSWTDQESEDGDATNRCIDIDIDKKKKKRRETPAPVWNMITAISAICAQTYSQSSNHQEFEDAAYGLIGVDITPEDVALFGQWWGRGNGFHKDKPFIKNILSHIKGARDSGWKDSPGPQSNGQPTPEDPAVWKLVTEAVSTGNYKGLSPEQFAAVKKVGPSEIKARNDFTANKVRAEFFRALQGAKC